MMNYFASETAFFVNEKFVVKTSKIEILKINED